MRVAKKLLGIKRLSRAEKGTRSNVNTIGIGSLRYDDVWRGAASENVVGLNHYLCPQIYHVDIPINGKGEPQLLLTQIARGSRRRICLGPADFRALLDRCNDHNMNAS